MKTERLTVYPLYQPYIMEFVTRDRLQTITVQRLTADEWLPLFHIHADDDTVRICALKTMESGELRTWYALKILMDWIRDEFEVYSVNVSLTDVQLIYTEEN